MKKWLLLSMPILKRFKKCSCNAPERQGQGQGNKSIGLGSSRAKKQAHGQKTVF